MLRLFGTDGIRGVVNSYPMTSDIAMKCGMSVGSYLRTHDERHMVVIAKDTRLSGYMIECALIAGFLSVGVNVVQVGPVPTPAVSMLIRSMRADMGVMISASHNPYQDNGLKLFNHIGLKISDEVQHEIEKIMSQNSFDHLLVAPDAVGSARRLDDAGSRYIEYVKNSCHGLALHGLNIVVDCANGAAYKLAPTIFWELGAKVIAIGNNPNGFNINDGYGSNCPHQISKYTRKMNADIGIAFDGDADRVVICDENGDIINGDNIIAAIAILLKRNNKLKNNAIVVTPMSNGALDETMQMHGIHVYRTKKIGDRYVYKMMSDVGAVLGGEQSGHIIFDKYSCTGDGILISLQVLLYLKTLKQNASHLKTILKPRPQVIANIAFDRINPLECDSTNTAINIIKNNHKDTRILVRKSGTENVVRIMVEGYDHSKITDIAHKISECISTVATTG